MTPGHNYIGHNYIDRVAPMTPGHNYIGHNYIDRVAPMTPVYCIPLAGLAAAARPALTNFSGREFLLATTISRNIFII